MSPRARCERPSHAGGTRWRHEPPDSRGSCRRRESRADVTMSIGSAAKPHRHASGRCPPMRGASHWAFGLTPRTRRDNRSAATQAAFPSFALGDGADLHGGQSHETSSKCTEAPDIAKEATSAEPERQSFAERSGCGPCPSQRTTQRRWGRAAAADAASRHHRC
jgi:hypothetical protein